MHYMPSLNNAIFLNLFSTLAASLRNNFILENKPLLIKANMLII